MLDIIFFSVLHILTIACSGTLYTYFKHMEDIGSIFQRLESTFQRLESNF